MECKIKKNKFILLKKFFLKKIKIKIDLKLIYLK